MVLLIISEIFQLVVVAFMILEIDTWNPFQILKIAVVHLRPIKCKVSQFFHIRQKRQIRDMSALKNQHMSHFCASFKIFVIFKMRTVLNPKFLQCI